jgi:hypothetical protein
MQLSIEQYDEATKVMAQGIAEARFLGLHNNMSGAVFAYEALCAAGYQITAKRTDLPLATEQADAEIAAHAAMADNALFEWAQGARP